MSFFSLFRKQTGKGKQVPTNNTKTDNTNIIEPKIKPEKAIVSPIKRSKDTTIPIQVDSKLIENILLCDPITERGRDKLAALNLDDQVGPKEFFEGKNRLWVNPNKDFSENTVGDKYEIIRFSPKDKEASIIKDRREEFSARFRAEEKRRKEWREFTLLMGVVGAGKSVELQHQIYENYSAIPFRYVDRNVDRKHSLYITPHAVLIDIEDCNQTVQIDPIYTCPDPNNALWLFCTKLLATLIYYIRFLGRRSSSNNSKESKAFKGLQGVLWARFRSKERDTSSIQESEVAFFDALNNYANGQKKIGEVFKEILKLLVSCPPANRGQQRNKTDDAATEDIRQILRLLSFVMIGLDVESKNCILVDNIEDYIKVGNATDVSVSHMHAKMIYELLRNHAFEIKDIFNDAGINASFSVVMALRRTTWGILESQFAGNQRPLLDDMFDITGDTLLGDIWKTKKQQIWDTLIAAKYENDADAFIRIADGFMKDAKYKNGVQVAFSRIMSRGLRRQGHSMSQALYKMFYTAKYGVFESKGGDFIDMHMYDALTSTDTDEASVERFMRRQAVLEYYFMDQYHSTGIEGNTLGERWSQLNIGCLEYEQNEDYLYNRDGQKKTAGRKYLNTEVYYKWPERISILHRILSILSTAPESPRTSKCIAPLYETISLYSIMKQLFCWPDTFIFSDLNPDNDKKSALEIFASVVLNATRPDLEADYSPLAILQVEPRKGLVFNYDDTSSFVKLLIEIWNAGEDCSQDGDHPYARHRFGIRIVEGGVEFLYNFRPSFPFFSGLYCSNLPPLYFVRSKDLILHIIGKVYHYADLVCTKYENEAKVFLNECGKDSLDGYRLPVIKKEIWTFRKRVQYLHIQYLHHYQDYIEKTWDLLGLSDEVRQDIFNEVEEAIKQYLNWNCNTQCF